MGGEAAKVRLVQLHPVVPKNTLMSVLVSTTCIVPITRPDIPGHGTLHVER